MYNETTGFVEQGAAVNRGMNMQTVTFAVIDCSNGWIRYPDGENVNPHLIVMSARQLYKITDLTPNWGGAQYLRSHSTWSLTALCDDKALQLRANH